MTISSSERFDVVVVGAGPAGSATAARLAAAGLEVALLDRARFPRPKPCAEYLSPGAVQALDRLGVLDEVLGDAPARLVGMRIVGPDGTGFTGRFQQGVGLALPRERLDHHVARFAERQGATFLQGATFASLDVTRHGVVLRAASLGREVELRARLVVGADGLNSRVAHQLGLARRGKLRRVALVAHATGVAGMSDVGEMHIGPFGYVGLAPLGGGVTNVAVVVDLGRDRVHAPLAAAFTRQLASFPTLRGRVEGAELLSPVRGVGPFGRTTRRASASRALLVGDAADFYDPFTGEGVYAALRGAELAAQCALEGARGLATYDRLRRRAFAAKWTLERIVSRVIARPRAFAHVARRLARHPRLADDLVSVTAHVAPASRVFRPSYAWRLVA